jgi:hypothetical protein
VPQKASAIAAKEMRVRSLSGIGRITQRTMPHRLWTIGYILRRLRVVVEG